MIYCNEIGVIVVCSCFEVLRKDVFNNLGNTLYFCFEVLHSKDVFALSTDPSNT